MLRLFKQYYPIRNIFFVLGEGILIIIAIYAASLILIKSPQSINTGHFFLKLFLIGVIFQACLYYNDLYDLSIINSYAELSIRLFQSLGASAIILAVLYMLLPGVVIGQGIFMLSTAFSMLLVVLWRYGYRMVLNRNLFNQTIVLLGSGELARNILGEIQKKRDCGYTPGILVKEPGQTEVCFEEFPCLATSIQRDDYEGLCELARGLGIQKIVVALCEKRGAFPVKELIKCRVDGIEIIDGNSFYEMLTGKLIVRQINPSWLIFSTGFRKSFLKRAIKRFVDLVFSAVLLISTLPIFLVVSLLIKIDSTGPVFFSQERVGRNRKPYMIYKFRSMVTDAESESGPVWAEDADDRITRIGRFIRKFRIDELPQLWNVLRGDMSFVGPRPEREYFVNELEQRIPYFKERMSVKPGITGWAQVCYGYGATVEDAVEKLNYDLFYIKNLTIFMDILIVLKTIKTVLFSKGAR